MLIWKCGEIYCESLKPGRLVGALKQGEMANTVLYCSSYLFLDSLGFLILQCADSPEPAGFSLGPLRERGSFL